MPEPAPRIPNSYTKGDRVADEGLAKKRTLAFGLTVECHHLDPEVAPHAFTAMALYSWTTVRLAMRPKNLPKESRRQVAFGRLQDEAPGCRMRRPAVPKSRCSEARQGLALYGAGQDEQAEIVEVVLLAGSPAARGPPVLWQATE